jgi:hypothetical protein
MTGDRRITPADQNQIHQQSRHGTFAVVEGMNFDQAAMRAKRNVRPVWGRSQPCRKIAHQRRQFRRRGKTAAPLIGRDVAALIGIAPGDVGLRAQHDQPM